MFCSAVDERVAVKVTNTALQEQSPPELCKMALSILLVIDMSKAFDTVSRSNLLNGLKEVLQRNELHMMSILINDASKLK